MLRYGIISKVDPAKGVARVAFDAEDGMESYWLQVIHRRTLEDQHYCMPDPGEHVACLMDEDCENGVILGAIYSKVDDVPPRGSDKSVKMEFRDGTNIEYDPENSELKVECLGTVKLKALGKIWIQGASDISINAGASVNIQAWDQMSIGVSGPATIKCADVATVYGNIVNVTAEFLMNLVSPTINMTATQAINFAAPAINAVGAATISMSAPAITTTGAATITMVAPMITLN